MANNQQRKKAYLKKRKASLKATKASLRKAQRKIYPWVSVKPPEFDDFRKFKKDNPVLPDNRPSIPDDYVRTPLVNWEYAFGDKKPDISKHWFKDDKPKIPIKNINKEHDNSVNLYDLITDKKAVSNLPNNTVFYSQNDTSYQLVAKLTAGSRKRFARYDEAKEQKLRKSVRSRSRITPLIVEDKSGKEMASSNSKEFGRFGDGLDATHLIPFGYHGSESDTRLLVMFPSSYNRVAMRKAEDKASNWKNDVIWFVSIEQKFYYDEYVEEESPIYDDKNNFTGETETRTVHKQIGRYLDWHYYITDSKTGEVVVDEHYIVDSSDKWGGTGSGKFTNLDIDWNIGADEAQNTRPESQVEKDNLDWTNGVNPCLLQDKSKWKYSYKDILTIKTKAKLPTSTIFGMTEDDEPFVYSLEEMVHLLVAGTTGSGKSVAVDSAVFKNIQSHATPDEVRYLAIDPKAVEYGQHIGSPYFSLPPQQIPNAGDMHDNSYALMLYVADLMDCRYKMLAEVECKNLSEYNDWVINNPEEAEAKGLPYMPRLIVPIDEYADLINVVGEEIETVIGRLGQKGRACGVILVVTTQRPTADVISTTLRSNLPSRWCLTVTDSITSNIALGEDGAENLNSKGDGYIKLQGQDKVRVQSWYYNPVETKSIKDYFKNEFPPQEDEPVFNYIVYAKYGEYMTPVNEETLEADKKVRLYPEKERGKRAS